MQQPTLEQIFGTFIPWQAKEGTWFINFMNGSENIYLLEGHDKALLLDTGWGTGNLRECVSRLTDKPLMVANTHFHPDHAAGNGEFEEVFVSAGYVIDEPAVASDFSPFDLSQLPYPDYKKTILHNGDIIDLGGRIIEVIEAGPAHCNSSLFFHDKTENLIFTGDEFEAAQTMLYDNSHNPNAPYDIHERIKNMRSNAETILSLCDKNTWILPNHNGFPIARSYIEDYIKLADAIYAGTAVIEDKLNHPYVDMDPRAPELCRVRYGLVSIFVKKAEILKVYGSRC